MFKHCLPKRLNSMANRLLIVINICIGFSIIYFYETTNLLIVTTNLKYLIVSSILLSIFSLSVFLKCHYIRSFKVFLFLLCKILLIILFILMLAFFYMGQKRQVADFALLSDAELKTVTISKSLESNNTLGIELGSSTFSNNDAKNIWHKFNNYTVTYVPNSLAVFNNQNLQKGSSPEAIVEFYFYSKETDSRQFITLKFVNPNYVIISSHSNTQKSLCPNILYQYQ